MNSRAIGVDIGGSGIKAGLVDVTTGQLIDDRVKLTTPEGGEPEAIIDTVSQLVDKLVGKNKERLPLGVCFPAVVQKGRTMSAANVSKRWIGLEAEKMFEKALGTNIHFVNDADAAGYAEGRYGAAKGIDGLVVMTTLGTGIGTALLHDGKLVANSELGHLQIEGVDWETKAAVSAKEREDLDWATWSERLQKYYRHLEDLIWPDLIIVGGGVSKSSEKFLPRLDIRTPIVTATLHNNAGISGAAALAADN